MKIIIGFVVIMISVLGAAYEMQSVQSLSLGAHWKLTKNKISAWQ